MSELAIQELLLICLNPNPIDAVETGISQTTPAVWEALLTLANKQHIAPLLYHRIKQHGLDSLLPADIKKQFAQTLIGNTVRNLKLFQELAEILKALQANNIPVLVLKGTHLANSVYPSLGLRTMSDCDIVVHEEDIPAAAELIMALGYQPEKPLQLELHKSFQHHLPLFIKHSASTSVELHWTITNPGQRYTITIEDWWARAQPFHLAGIEAKALCPEDLLLHLCLHATYQHRFLQGIRPLCDITETVMRYGADLDWTAICERSQAWGWTKGVYLALYLSQALVGAAIPASVLETLKPSELSLDLVETAKAQIFSAYEELGATTSNHFMQMHSRDSLSEKIKVVLSRVLVPKRQLAFIYGIPTNSPRLYWYYWVRSKDLLFRYYKNGWRSIQGESELTQAAHHRNHFVAWLEQP